LGRCHDSVLKVEQLYTLKHVSDGLNEVSGKMSTCIDTNKIQFGLINKQFKQFIDKTNEKEKAITA
jgi:hypothetical protein